jgi:hypothetical protein
MKQIPWLAGVALSALAFTSGAGAQVVVSGTIRSDQTWTADNTYILSGTVFVEGATVTIEPGTTIMGENATNGTFVIARSGRLLAEGTADEPIVFTSDQPVGQRARGDWGGLILNGRAPINVPGGTAEGEGDTGTFGGNQPADDSGVLRYVRVEFAGTEFSPDNELNGIALQGVGNSTVVDFVQIHFNLDDGIEMFGGTVDLKHVVCSYIGDDLFDWTEGWNGRAQFVVGVQRGDEADQGIEADNNAENNDLTPRSNPTLFNITLIGDPDFNEGDASDLGMLLREGTAATIRNFIVYGFKEKGLEIDHEATFEQAAEGNLVLSNGIFFANGVDFSDDSDEDPPPPFTTEQFATAMSEEIRQTNPKLRKPNKLANPDFRPKKGSIAVLGRMPVAEPPNDGFFEEVDFIGALGWEKSADWTQGWTNYAQS